MNRQDRDVTNRLKRWIKIIEIMSESREPLKIKSDSEKRSIGILDKLIDSDIVSMKNGIYSISKKSIERDLSDLEELEYVIAERYPSGKKNGYYSFNTKKLKFSPVLLKLSLSDEIIQSLYLSKEIFRAFEGTSFYDSINEFYSQITLLFKMTKNYDGPVDDLAAIVKNGPRRVFTDSQSIALDDIISAMNDRCEIYLWYAFPWLEEDVGSYVKPHKLIQYHDSLYLLATNRNDKFRMYNLSRVRSVDIKEKHFTPKETSDFEEKLRHSFGILVEGRVSNVKILFDSSVKQPLYEREWHPSATLKETKKGTLLSMKVLVNDELASWVRSWGKAVVSISPKKLERLVKEL